MSDVAGDPAHFREEMLKLGHITAARSQTLWEIGLRCAKSTGVPMGAAFGLLSAGAGSVSVPGIGAVPGYVAGALAGFVTGTLTCGALSYSERKAIEDFAEAL